MKKILDIKRFGPWALITGASSGIGKEFSLALASMGFNVVLLSRRQNVLQELGNEIKKRFNVNYKVIQADLSDPAFLEKIKIDTKELDIGLLISNAGGAKPGNFSNLDHRDLLNTIQINTLSHLELVHHFTKKFELRGSGGIILTGAMGASEGIPYMANESGTKAYIKAFGTALNYELKSKGIYVTVLETSPTQTPVFTELKFTKKDFPFKPLNARQCVDETLNALKKNKASIVPGRKFRIMKSLVPSSISRSMMAKALKKNHNLN